MKYETLWHIGLIVLVPLGILTTIAGVVIGLLAHIWIVLWIGVGVLVTGIALGPMSMLGQFSKVHQAAQRWEGRTIIGQGIRWEDVKGQFFQVLDFAPNASVEGEKVKANSRFTPYAMLTVDSPAYQEALTMPVLHRVDFLHLWKCFHERAVGDVEELMVSYHPNRLGKNMPHFALLIGPKGATQCFAPGSKRSQEVYEATRFYWNPEEAMDFHPTSALGRWIRRRVG